MCLFLTWFSFGLFIFFVLFILQLCRDTIFLPTRYFQATPLLIYPTPLELTQQLKETIILRWQGLLGYIKHLKSKLALAQETRIHGYRKTNQERGITLALDGGDLASGIMVLFDLDNEILAHAHLTLHMDHVWQVSFRWLRRSLRHNNSPTVQAPADYCDSLDHYIPILY